MEIIILLILIIAVILILQLKKELNDKTEELHHRIESVRRSIDSALSAAEKLNLSQKPSTRTSTPAVTPAPVATFKPEPPKVKEEEIPEKKIIEPQAIFEHVEEKEPELLPQLAFSTAVTDETISYANSSPSSKKEAEPEPEPDLNFFEKNPDLEKFIGENLANKIGIAILVLGIGFFVKYAIDQHWINEIGRVFIGIICGGILVSVAHKLRYTFPAFSSVLVGGGIAVLYFTIAIAFHEYRLFSQTAAFLLMVVITGFSVLFSLAYDRKELAVLSIIGGFATPFMLSTGEGNYIVLFTYLLVLNLGMLVLAYHKHWKIVYIISYAFTILIFGGWLTSKFIPGTMTMGALAFAASFYLVFFFMNIINNLKERNEIKELEIWLLLSNTFLFYTAGMYILNDPAGYDFRGLFTASMGVFNFIFAYTLFKNKAVDKNIIYILIGLVLTFISLAVPVQLEGHHITLFWAAETVLLLWLSQKSGIRLIKYTSLIVLGLMIISLVMDWAQIYFSSQNDLNIVLNKAYLTSIFALASIIITHRILKAEDEEENFDINYYKTFLIYAGIAIFYTFNLLELDYHLSRNVSFKSSQTIILGVYILFFMFCLVLLRRRLPSANRINNFAGYAGVLAIAVYLIAYFPAILHARNQFLLSNTSGTGFYFHYLLLAVVLVLAILGLRNFIQSSPSAKFMRFTWWFFMAAFIFIASAELDNIVLLTSNIPEVTIKQVLRSNHKIGFPILWGISAFIIIFIGMRNKIKDLRIISLTLLCITLLKLFLFDIRGISEAGKIVAFISLGVLLLIVSFMYQKLKKLLLEDVLPTDEGEKA